MQLKAVILVILLMMVITAEGRDPALGCQLEEDCGLSRYPWFERRRIMNGLQARPKQFPWFVDIGYWACGGALITRRYVITAKHCNYDFKTKEWGLKRQVGFGSHTRFGGMRVWTVDFRAHPTSDIIMQKLPYDVTFDDYVNPACFPPVTPAMDEENFKDANIIQAGWGDTKGREDDEILHWGMTHLRTEGCASHQICTYGVTSSVGYGDSGSPLFMRHQGRMYLVGVISGIHHVRRKLNRYEYSTDIYKAREWIFNSIAEMDGKPNHCQVNQTNN